MNRVLRSACPSCGAPVEFRAGSSVLAVCGYCRSTLLRDGPALRDLGKMAQLFDDHSPLALGAAGRDDGLAFTLIGRLQYRYPEGTWNEWRALFDDGSTGWLSEDSGAYVLSRERAPIVAAPFDEIEPGQQIWVHGVPLVVAGKELARVVAGAGELPFVVGAGYEAPVVDLRGDDGEFATLDYSDYSVDTTRGAAKAADDASVRVYVGRAVSLGGLRMTGLREEIVREVATTALACPSCGAPVQARLADTRAISCASCAAVLDLTAGPGAKIDFYRQLRRVAPLVPLGSSCERDGARFTVVGFMRREGRAGDERFEWDEFLLHAPTAGFRFLIHDAGHWSWSQVLQKAVRVETVRHGRGVARLGKERFDQFAEYEARVLYVEGEFYWQVRAGEITRNTEYVLPPSGLSCERSGREVSWSRGEYLDAAAVRALFGLPASLPAPSGVGMLQPVARSRWPWAYRALLAASLASVIAVYAGYSVGARHRVLVGAQPVAFDARGRDHLVEIAGPRAASLVVVGESNVTNDAFELAVDVVAQGDGRSLEGMREIGFWEGRADGEYWSEGARSARLAFTKLPPGRYLVQVRGAYEPVGGALSAPAGRPPAFAAQYRIEEDSRPNALLVPIALALLVVLHVLATFRMPDPLAERWADSQYGTRPGRPAAGGSDDDDDDG